MTVKNERGRYECRVCGKAFEYKQKAENHEQLCGVSGLDDFVEGMDTLRQDLSQSQDGKTLENSKQIKIGQNFVGNCPNCGKPITDEDVYNEPKGIYECSGCENIINVERAE